MLSQQTLDHDVALVTGHAVLSFFISKVVVKHFLKSVSYVRLAISTWPVLPCSFFKVISA